MGCPARPSLPNRQHSMFAHTLQRQYPHAVLLGKPKARIVPHQNGEHSTTTGLELSMPGAAVPLCCGNNNGTLHRLQTRAAVRNSGAYGGLGSAISRSKPISAGRHKAVASDTLPPLALRQRAQQRIPQTLSPPQQPLMVRRRWRRRAPLAPADVAAV